MNLRFALLAAAVTVFAACGDDSNNGNNDAGFTLESGTYAVSGATATGTDECGLLPAYQDPSKKIGITVNATTVSFNLANDPSADPDSIPTATLNGNLIENPVEANYTVGYTAPDCVVRVHRNVIGTLTADNTADLTLAFSADWEPSHQGTCTAADTSFAQLPCGSTYNYTATKTP